MKYGAYHRRQGWQLLPRRILDRNGWLAGILRVLARRHLYL